MALEYFRKEVLPCTAMVAVECTSVGSKILFKAATLRGMSYYVFITYSYVVATFILLPFTLIFRSTAVLPQLKFPLISRICLFGLIGFVAHMCGYKGIEYGSPTLASAISSLTPAFTFILAIIFRMENGELRSSSTQAKIIGTIASISGALVIIFYKGPEVFSSPTLTPSSSVSYWPLESSQSNWATGGLLLAVEYLLASICYIIQTQVMKIYPAELIVVFCYNLCGTIISAPVCLLAESSLSAWRLRPSIAKVAVVYSGFTGTFLGVLVHIWGLRVKGPVYVALFMPLSIPIAAVLSAIFLGDTLHLGSVIGAVILSVGFYAVIWGKAKEKMADSGFSSLASSSQAPLLQTQCNEARTQ
ncbi:WAT1-related protein At4g15540-like isoform X2 [Herrania umbratica]|uniref:WAT1-related protein n=1 Tax=Herrania umbratica TaxID=108875 RepID=A0A6J1BJA1_9ROSI|nr:WAT1-related protein At4g15540-like isoform X2 [Herrania umbratica]